MKLLTAFALALSIAACSAPLTQTASAVPGDIAMDSAIANAKRNSSRLQVEPVLEVAAVSKTCRCFGPNTRTFTRNPCINSECATLCLHATAYKWGGQCI